LIGFFPRLMNRSIAWIENATYTTRC